MFKVQITYKSGKVETTNIEINQYSAALKQLADEKRVTEIKIIGVA